jgi:hypothetical protein
MFGGGKRVRGRFYQVGRLLKVREIPSDVIKYIIEKLPIRH